MMTDQQFREELRLIAFRVGSQKILAQQLGISPQQLSFAITGKRPPCDAILERLGYEAVVTREYRKVKPSDAAQKKAPSPQA